MEPSIKKELWEICLKRNRWKRNFQMTLRCPDSELTARGTYNLTVSQELSVQLEGLGPRPPVNLNLLRANSNIWTGHSTLAGDITVEGETVGHCEVKNSHTKDEPVVRIDLVGSTLCLEAFRTHPRRTACPLGVRGVTGAEVVLGDFRMLREYRLLPPELEAWHRAQLKGRSVNRGLRKYVSDALRLESWRMTLVGVCSVNRDLRPHFSSAIPWVALLAVVTEILVVDFFMDTN